MKANPETQGHYQGPEKLIEQYRELVTQGDMDISTNPFVQSLKAQESEGVEVDDIDTSRLRIPIRRIKRTNRNAGIGYLSASANHDRQKEMLATKCIADAFETREAKIKPLIIPIDSFYKFIPSTASLVTKIQTFDEIARRQDSQQNYVFILSDFTESNVFTQEILEQVPTQINAGLELFSNTEFGRKLLDFSQKELPVIIERENGDLRTVINVVGGGQERDTRLLLAIGLLLQDIQRWQGLSYEGREKGTPLYIVAPFSFHNAMNRLNFEWGHGATDYRYRASSSLGNFDDPVFGEVGSQDFNTIYHKQGLSQEEFRRRVEPILFSRSS